MDNHGDNVIHPRQVIKGICMSTLHLYGVNVHDLEELTEALVDSIFNIGNIHNLLIMITDIQNEQDD